MSIIDILEKRIVNSSFRDPSGYLYWEGDTLYRHINPSYIETYDYLISSGLCSRLFYDKLLLLHKRVSEDTIRPEIIPFISYPYEWCFSELKDAALLTLRIQEIAMEYGMILKDASAYNVQFLNGKPIFIDTLSFDIYKEGQAWEGYNQFCQHFLAPLALMAYKDVRLSQLLRVYIDGIPLDLASSLIPKTKLWQHIHANALMQRKLSHKKYNIKISKRIISNLVTHLRLTVENMKWKSTNGWKDYERECNYSDIATHKKAYIVEDYLKRVRPNCVLDLGANVGIYSQVAMDLGIRTIAIDSDPACVELCYQSNDDGNCLPLVMDLANPSSDIGWANKERDSLLKRVPVDCVMALALMHHLLISNNVPMGELASFLGSLCKNLIIEFVPKEDSQVQRLLINRNDLIHYTQESFEIEFIKEFEIIEKSPIQDTLRVLYLMKNSEC